jgi:hypothetical protein
MPTRTPESAGDPRAAQAADQPMRLEQAGARSWVSLLAAALWGCFLALSASSVPQKSASWDETHYLGAGPDWFGETAFAANTARRFC